MSFEKAQSNLVTCLISGTPSPLTRFRDVFKSFVNSVPNTLSLKDIQSNELIIARFNEACLQRIDAIVNEHLFVDDPLSLLSKSESTSDLFRARGNEYYKKKRVREALRCYTLAVAFAPSSSKNAALSYSNRSACFYESGDLSACLDDIHLFESIYPNDQDNVVARLRERKQKCLDKMQPTSEPLEIGYCAEIFRLESANSAIPSAESFIGIRNSEKRGRHVVNAGDAPIPPGRVIILERPFSHVLLRDHSFEYKHCATCLKDLNGAGVPCSSCVFALYCSNTCATSTQNPHNTHKCLMSRYFYELKPDRTVKLATWILLSIPDTELTSEKAELSGDWIPETYDSSDYSTIRNLIYHKDNLTDRDLITYASYATAVTCILKRLRTLHDATALSFATHLLLHQMNLPCNAHSLYKLSRQSVEAMYEEIGAGAFSLLSLINHSCDPNVVRITLNDGVNAVVTIRHVNANDEILDNYGVHFATDKLATRCKHVTDLYNFACDCTPCQRDWPMIDKLMAIEPEDHESVKRDDTTLASKDAALKWHESSYECLQSSEFVKSFELSRSALQYFDLNFKKPCSFVCVSQEYMKQAIFLVANSLFRKHK